MNAFTSFAEIEARRAALAAAARARPFGGWLLAQADRDQWVGRLASYARRDRHFPRHGSSRDVTARIVSQAVDEEMRMALQDALSEWRTLIRRTAAQHGGSAPNSVVLPQ